MKTREALYIVVMIIVVVLFMGKTLGLPVALMLVSGDSMKPTLNPLDLVLGVQPSLKGGVHTGDIVVVVLPGSDWRTTGVIHRVVKIYEANGAELVVTRGDNVKYNDPPVPLDNVKYIVTGKIPNYITIPALGLLLGFMVGYYALYYPYKRWEEGVLPPPGSLATTIILVFALFNMAYVGAVYLDSTPNKFTIPIFISESVEENLQDNTVTIILHYENTSILGVKDCFFTLDGEKFNTTPALARNDSRAIITVQFTRSLWISAWNYTSERIIKLPSYPARISEYFFLKCNVLFTDGLLRSSYPLQVVWSEPLFLQGNNGSLVIVNRNPLALNMSLTLLDVNISKTIMSQNINVARACNTTIKIPEASRGHLIRIMAYYDFLGVHRFYGGFIHG